MLGTCAYRGQISPKAITRVSVFDYKTNVPMAAQCIEATITLGNHLVCAKEYALLTRWCLGYPVTPLEWAQVKRLAPTPGTIAEAKKFIALAYPDAEAWWQAWTEALGNQTGIEIFERK